MFKDYPKFYETPVGGNPNRMKHRYYAIIDWNKEEIAGSKILDIASHDGRWSFAALKAGAESVIGVEARPESIKKAIDNMEHYGISKNKYKFILGDVHNLLSQFESNEFDVIFCLGFFYHTTQHIRLIKEMLRIKPKLIILDTAISKIQGCVIELQKEETYKIGNAVGPDKYEITGRMSKDALEMMLENFNCTWKYYDWNAVKNWEQLSDYKAKTRETLSIFPRKR